MYSSGPWPLKILMFALLVTHEIATVGKRLEMTNIPQMPLKQEIDDDIDVKILRAGHAFPKQLHMHQGRLFISVKVFFPV
jgi:hypothetical protein